MKTIDITKVQPTNWKYIVGLILVVFIILLAIAIGTWLWNFIKGLGGQITGGKEMI